MAIFRMLRTALTLLFLAGVSFARCETTATVTWTPVPNAGNAVTSSPGAAVFAGSRSCKQCHAEFYAKWSTSHHGLAMQPYSSKFAQENLTSQTEPIVIDKMSYLAQIGPDQGWVIEKGSGGEKHYPIKHVMGGKNVYYFLTPLEKGRLQALPLAYDVHTKKWFDMAASGVRHFHDTTDSALNWKEWPFTFNTACFNCHVSQLATNYDLKTDTYNTVWLEPGINCETCHGPASEHNRTFAESPKNQKPKDLKIISTRTLTNEQNTAICASCHAKMSPLTKSFKPGDGFFDHYDLITYESPDYYPDGRDLGENYTMTSWMMSPCARSGKLDCVHCHTSSGRYKFSEADANNACMPCHKQQVDDLTSHTHHLAKSSGSKCVACHMPMTGFAAMNRTDHSMRPPMPAATLEFKSPNACNICHKDKDAKWSDKYVREWRTRDYQAATLKWASLIDDARKQKWERLPEMLKYLSSPDRNEVVANSLVRLIRGSSDESRLPVLVNLTKDPSPLVRASVADALGDRLTPEILPELIKATSDTSRLVRIRAAGVLAGVPAEMIEPGRRASVQAAMRELEESFAARPDDAGSHYNEGNYYGSKHEPKRAVECYETAMRLRPDFVLPLVNASLAYNAIGDNQSAEKVLRRAIELEPKSVPAYLNLAMLLGEMDRMKEAEAAFHRVLELDPNSATAAYNLAVMSGKDGRLEEAAAMAGKAAEANPSEPKYAFTQAYYLDQKGDRDAAADVLRRSLEKNPSYLDSCQLLASIYADRGKASDAENVLLQALGAKGLSGQDRAQLEAQLKKVRSRQ